MFGVGGVFGGQRLGLQPTPTHTKLTSGDPNVRFQAPCAGAPPPYRRGQGVGVQAARCQVGLVGQERVVGRDVRPHHTIPLRKVGLRVVRQSGQHPVHVGGRDVGVVDRDGGAEGAQGERGWGCRRASQQAAVAPPSLPQQPTARAGGGGHGRQVGGQGGVAGGVAHRGGGVSEEEAGGGLGVGKCGCELECGVPQSRRSVCCVCHASGARRQGHRARHSAGRLAARHQNKMGAPSTPSPPSHLCARPISRHGMSQSDCGQQQGGH